MRGFHEKMVRSIVLAATGLLIFGCSAPDRGVGRRPNIVLIVSDDQGYAEMSGQGGDVPTPHLDRLAASGIRFTAGYVTAPFCSPSRAGLLTGRYQQRFGHEMNPVEKTNDRPEVGLPVSEKTIADHLRNAGYATGMVGKWHLGAHPPYHPLRRGFQEFFGFLREGHFYGAPDRVVSRLREREPEYDRLNPILRGESEVEEKDYLTTAFGREASAFIDRHARDPFFLYLPFNAPHSPMQATPRDLERFASIADPHRRIWAAMLASMDDAVGTVLASLRKHGLERDTLVIFVSDNGGPTKELTSRNDPFSGGKGSVLEGGIRVPFLLSWPGKLPAGVVERRPVSALDVLPTALAAASSPMPSGLDGVDLLPFLTGERTELPHPTLTWRMGGQLAIRCDRWKLVRLKASEPFRLFDLDQDEKESRDLAAREPDRVRELQQRLLAWDRELAPPLW
jgi:arylsulfatase A-like enzyme